MANSRHLWVGGLPEDMSEEDIRDYFTRFGKVEGIKLLPQRYPKMGLAAFIDFYERDAAVEAHNTEIKIQGCEVRTNYKSARPETKEGKEHSHRYYNSPDRVHKQDSSCSSSSDVTSDSATSSSSSSSDSDGEDEVEERGGKKKSKEMLMLKVTNLAQRPDHNLHEVLHNEFIKYTSKPLIKFYGEEDKKYAIVKFKSSSECKKAIKESQGCILFGYKVKLNPYHKEDFSRGSTDSHPPHSKGVLTRSTTSDDIDSNATRSIFVGNIPKNISIYELRDVFQRYGPVLDVEIKKMTGNATYGFILFYDLHSAISAKRYMDGTVIGGNNIRVGFGKGTASKVLWVDGVDPSLSESQLEKHFSKYGNVVRMGFDRQGRTAMVQYETVDEAKEALGEIKGGYIGNNRSRIMADFANKDAKAAFFTRLETPGGPRPFPPPTPMYPDHMMGPPSMMMPGPRPVPMMHTGMGPIPPHGPPMDYYGYPYMDAEYYGYRPFPSQGPIRHAPQVYETRGYGDYEDELKAFSRKRERERRKEKENRRNRYDSTSDESDSDDNNKRTRGRRKRRSTTSKSDEEEEDDSSRRGRDRRKQRDEDKKREKRETSEGSNHLERNEIRKKDTRKSRDYREKQRSKHHTQKLEDDENKSREEKKNEFEKQSMKENKEKNTCQEVKKRRNDEVIEEKKRDKEELTRYEEKEKQVIKERPKVVIEYELEEEEEEEEQNEINVPTEIKIEQEVKPVTSTPGINMGDEPHKVMELETHDSQPSEHQPLLLVSERPKISISWMERDKPSKMEHLSVIEEKHRIESDFSSGDEFNHIDPAEEDIAIKEKTDLSKNNREINQESSKEKHNIKEKTVSSHVHKRREVILSHSSETSSEGGEKRSEGGEIKRGSYHRDGDDRGSDDKYKRLPHRYKPQEEIGGHRQDFRQHNHRYSPSHDRHHRYHQEHLERRIRRHGSPPYRHHSPHQRTPVRSGSPPLSPPRGRPRTPIQRPLKSGRYHPSSPQHEFPRGRHSTHHRQRSPSPPVRSRFHRDRDRSPLSHSRVINERSHRDSPHHSRYPPHSRTPTPPSRRRTGRPPEPPDSKRRKVEDREEASSRPRTPSGSPPPPEKKPQEMPPLPLSKPSEPPPLPSINQQQTAENQIQVHEPLSTVHQPESKPPPPQADVLDLLRRYPVMWQGHLMLKNELAAIQLHFLSGNVNLAQMSLPQSSDGTTPNLRISQRMRLEQTQLEGVERRIKNNNDHCLLLALPCGRDPIDVQSQTATLKNSLITYLLQKQAAGIINVQGPQVTNVLHIFPPCQFSQMHLSRVAPDLLSSASENCHLMIVIATV